MDTLIGAELDRFVGGMLGIDRAVGESDDSYRKRTISTFVSPYLAWYKPGLAGATGSIGNVGHPGAMGLPGTPPPAHWGNIGVYGPITFTYHCIETGTTLVAPAARDGNGSLLCQGCGEPNQYAEPAADGSFRCYGCRVTL